MKNKRDYTSDRSLVFFFTATLLWTWGCGFIPVMLGLTGSAIGTFLFYFGGGAPSVVALFLVFFTYPREAVKDYFHRCFSLIYMGWKWPLITIGIFSAITVISLLIGVAIIILLMIFEYIFSHLSLLKEHPFYFRDIGSGNNDFFSIRQFRFQSAVGKCLYVYQLIDIHQAVSANFYKIILFQFPL